MRKKLYAIYMCSLLVLGMSSCVEELKTENFYTFTGETITDYVENRDSLSLFADILRRSANPRMADLLDAYGQYTCFVPHNDAVRAFLAGRGLSDVSELPVETCDTIACTHVIKVEYPTIDMPEGVLSRPNMSDRYIQVAIDSGTVYINKTAKIVVRDEELENGVVHVIDQVLQHSTTAMVDMIEQDSRISLFNKAMDLTGFKEQLRGYIDFEFDKMKRDNDLGDGVDRTSTQKYYPSARYIGYTGFIETNEVLANVGVDTTSIDGLIQYAKEIYGASFPEDKEGVAYGANEYTNPKHPLYRYVAYHFLNRRIYTDKMTTYFHFPQSSHDAFDFYETMCKGTILKASRGAKTNGITRLNRRYTYPNALSHGKEYGIEGVEVNEAEMCDGSNGVYYLVNAPLVYSKEVSDVVLLDRMRFDAATLMPELATNNIFRNGDGTENAGTRGKAYQIPNTLEYSYVKDLKIYQEAIVYYQCPVVGFWCWYADEIIAEGSYDFAIKLPPVPAERTYEIRYGYVPMSHRGVTQVYIEEVGGPSIPCGIPVDLTEDGTSQKIGWFDDSDCEDEDEMLKREKAMHNRHYMKGPLTQTEGTNKTAIARDMSNHLRRIVATKYLESGKEYYIRFRAVDESGKEFMFDYLELCPKDVYDNPAMQEDRL